MELFSGLAISLYLFSLPTGPLASPRLRSHPRYTFSTLWIPFDFPIHLISAPFGLLSGVSILFPRTQSKRKVLLMDQTSNRLYSCFHQLENQPPESYVPTFKGGPK